MVFRVRILLTGGTGFLGSLLRAALEERGDDVRVVSRRASTGGPGLVGWDKLEDQVAHVDAVVHLAGEPLAESRWTAERWERIRSSRVDTTARIARAIVEASARPRVLVSTSAVGIYGARRDDVVCDETTPPGDGVVAQLCVAWEAAAAPARDAGVRVAHPRIGIALGRDGGALPRMVTAFRWFVGGPVGDGMQWLSWIHVRDVVRALLLLLDGDGLSGAYDLVAPEPVTMNELAHAVGRALGRPAAMRVPPLAVRALFGRGLAETLLTGQRVAPKRLVDAGFTFHFPRIDRALADLL
jgi:uncharacterized protein (TIGR01777 family)